MTEENYQYRTSQTMLRNQFEGEGFFQTPIIPKSSFSDEEFENLLLIGFDRAGQMMQRTVSVWYISFYTITSLNGYGKMRKRIWKD